MKTYVTEGKTIDFTNAGVSTIPNGSVVVIGGTLGFALADIAPGSTGTVAIDGVWTAPKVPDAVFATGEKLVWDASANAFDDSAAALDAGDVRGGAVAFKSGENGQTSCVVVLTPGNTDLGE